MNALKYIYGVLSIIVVGIYTNVCAQSTSVPKCDYTITKSGVYKNSSLRILPGQTVCIQAGTYTHLHFSDFSGTKEKPIRFTNYGGKVVVNSTAPPAGIQFYVSNYFILSGTGTPGIEYGIFVQGTGPNGGQAVRAENKSSDCEIDHIEIGGSGFAGIMVKTDPTCDSTTWRENLVVRNVKVHHNYIHDTSSEGMYIGNTFWNVGYTLTCGGKTRVVYPHSIYGLEIHHNLTERTGAEGIQYAAAPDASVHDNIIKNSGLTPFAAFQNNGLQLGPGVGGNLYNNQIINAAGVGLTIIGNGGNTNIFNNLIVNSGSTSVFCDDRPGTNSNTPIRFFNNTIINSGEDGIKLYNEINNNYIINNIIAKVGKGRRYISFDQGATAEVAGNFLTSDIDSVGFVNAAGDNYRLKNNSKLIDTGLNRTASLVNIDLDNNRRPIGRQIDIGAYEYHPETDQLLTLYPSPCDDLLSIWTTEPIQRVKIYSLNGKELLQISPNPSNDMTINVKSFEAGLYLLQVDTDSKSITKRFIKR